jgi:dihydrofolate reductase
MAELNVITAMTSKRVIGKGGKIPWKIPEEMKLFKDITMGNAVIMGKNTWFSLPEKFRPLPGRANIIVSGSILGQNGATVCKNIEEALMFADKLGVKVFCIGGAQLYSTMLGGADVLHVSWIKKDYDGDAYFPEINFSEWKESEVKDYPEFTYKRYVRVKVRN